MVEATDFANRDDLAEFRPLNSAAVGGILVEREVSTRPVVVREVASQGAAQVPFAKDEDVIQALAPDGSDEPLREGVLPWAVRRREDFTDAHALHALPEHVTVDRVAVAQEVGRGGVVREGVHDLLGVQAAVGCSVTLKWRTRRRWWARMTKTKRTRKRAVGTVTKSIETRSRTWLVRNIRQVCDGGERRSRETVRSATSMPS